MTSSFSHIASGVVPASRKVHEALRLASTLSRLPRALFFETVASLTPTTLCLGLLLFVSRGLRSGSSVNPCCPILSHFGARSCGMPLWRAPVWTELCVQASVEARLDRSDGRGRARAGGTAEHGDKGIQAEKVPDTMSKSEAGAWVLNTRLINHSPSTWVGLHGTQRTNPAGAGTGDRPETGKGSWTGQKLSLIHI